MCPKIILNIRQIRRTFLNSGAIEVNIISLYNMLCHIIIYNIIIFVIFRLVFICYIVSLYIVLYHFILGYIIPSDFTLYNIKSCSHLLILSIYDKMCPKIILNSRQIRRTFLNSDAIELNII